MTENTADHTEPATAPEPPTPAAETPGTATTPTTDGHTADTASRASRDAARYRHQLRQTQAERDQLAETVTQLRRDAARHALTGRLNTKAAADVADQLTADQLANLYGPHGLDPDQLNQLAADQLAAHPYMAPTDINPLRRIPTGGSDPTTPIHADALADAIRKGFDHAR